LAVLLNAILLAGLLTYSLGSSPKGDPSAVRIVSVDVIPLQPTPASPTTPDPGTAGAIMTEDAAQPNASSERTANTAVLEPPSQAPAATRGGTALPEVALPETDPGWGMPEGIVGLDCNARFDDRVQAAECVGEVVTSASRYQDAMAGEDWSRIAAAMRRAGKKVPFYGPDDLAGLGPTEEVYEPSDPRYMPRPRGGRYREAFETQAELDAYNRLRDFRTYRGEHNPIMADHGTPPSEPLSGWLPSWQLREDPVIDQRALRQMERAAGDAE
jgi:hypothetical protein